MARIVVTGGAGFVGSHLCDAFIARGDEVLCLDNLSSGHHDNVAHLIDNAAFTFTEADVRDSPSVDGPVDLVLHFASPASPKFYLRHPLLTLETGSIGTQWCLELAQEHNARFLLASTSEVYGDPREHPQTESYWGNVNPIGERSVYDEAKRYAEALTMAYRRSRGVDTAIVRIFNTYGPRMRADDGRVLSTFVNQALAGDPLSVFGTGEQTRSFCYISDLVAGVLAMADSTEPGPINLGNPVEYTIAELASIVMARLPNGSVISHNPLPADDPTRRQPDISQAQKLLGWVPVVDLDHGLTTTINFLSAPTGEAS